MCFLQDNEHTCIYYFCTPDILKEQPELITYYRNVAMMSQKAMNDMGLSTTDYEARSVPPPDIAQNFALTELSVRWSRFVR